MNNPRLINIINAVIYLRRAEAKSCSQVVPIKAALVELEAAYRLFAHPMDLQLDLAVEAREAELATEGSVLP